MLEEIFRKKTEDWFYSKLSFEQSPKDTEIKTVQANEGYVHVFLKSMRLVNVRQGLSKFYPVLHSYISMSHKKGVLAEFNTVTMPKHLGEMDARNLDRIVNFNQRLLGPIPYRGGDLKMEVGLFSIKSADLAKPFLDLLGEISDLSGVSYLGTAMSYIGLLKQGINLLTSGNDDSILEIGLDQVLNPLETGYYVVMRAPKQVIDANMLMLSEHDYRLVMNDGSTIRDYPYFVIQIFTAKTRDDWFMIPEIAKAYQELEESMEQGNEENINLNFQIFKRKVLTSKDLLYAHAKTIVEGVENEVQNIKGSLKEETFRGDAEKLTVKALKDIPIKF
jgi:hypothetical protein